MDPLPRTAPGPRSHVLVDTVTFKLAITRRVRAEQAPQTIDWGHARTTVEVTRFVEDFPLERLQPGQRYEAGLLPYVAYLARQGRCSYLSHLEVLLELATLPRARATGDRFLGAPLTFVRGPVPYSRIVAGAIPGEELWYKRQRGERIGKARLVNFLAKLAHPRFLELQRASGASQGATKPPNANQLIDAWHLWCAEGAGAEYFLTLDESLIRRVAQERRAPPRVQAVLPSALLADLRAGKATWRDRIAFELEVLQR
jgi:hypothetical protein